MGNQTDIIRLINFKSVKDLRAYKIFNILKVYEKIVKIFHD